MVTKKVTLLIVALFFSIGLLKAQGRFCGGASASIPFCKVYNSIKNDSQLLIYPNPAPAGTLPLVTSGDSTTFSITDNSGRVLYKEANISKLVLLKSGTYLLKTNNKCLKYIIY
jgi:hypothetical protein